MVDPTHHLVTSTSGGNKDLDMGKGSPEVSIQLQENLGPDLPGVSLISSPNFNFS